MRSALLLALLALAACGTGEPLAQCRGPVFPLNTGHWQPTPADLHPAQVGTR